MKKKTIQLPSIPVSWKAVSLEQFKAIDGVKGTFRSQEAWLTYCFLALTGLKPLRYKEAWRALLSSVPILGRFVKETGRVIVGTDTDFDGTLLLLSGQYYCFSGFLNFWFGRRFLMQDQELLSFIERLRFLTDKDEADFVVNPVTEKEIGGVLYKTHQALLSDMTWEDYNRCSMFIELYASGKEIRHLDKFLSVIYKIDRVENVRSYFTQLEINLILTYWNNSQKYFKRSFPHMFKSGSKEEKSRDYMKKEAEITVFLGKEAYSSPEEVRKMRAYDALQYLEMNAIIYEERERQIKQMKRK